MMIRHLLGPFAACILLMGCGGAGSDGAADAALPPPSPALWSVSNQAGDVEGWLFGTIHALPDNVTWRTEALDQALRQSDALAVEIADLDDESGIARTFYQLALSADQPPLVERVSGDRRKKLLALMAKGKFGKGEFQSTETWAAAITLAQIASIGDSDNGVDRALLRGFGGRPVLEFEGVQKQLGIFDTLPAKEQVDLLHAVIDQADSNELGTSEKLMHLWRSGDVAALAAENDQGMLADPELRDALLTRRNQDWVRQLEGMFAARGPIMVAVGAAHLAGDDGLPAILAKQGYVVTRVQ